MVSFGFFFVVVVVIILQASNNTIIAYMGLVKIYSYYIGNIYIYIFLETCKFLCTINFVWSICRSTKINRTATSQSVGLWEKNT